jgi:hypothetical protein
MARSIASRLVGALMKNRARSASFHFMEKQHAIETPHIANIPQILMFPLILTAGR